MWAVHRLVGSEGFGSPTFVRLADHPPLRAVELELAGGRAVASHLVLDARGRHAVELPDGAVVVDEALGHEEERDALGPRRRVGQAREDGVYDVRGEVVLAARDEDLGAGDRVRAVVARLGARRQLAQVGAALRLGEAHRAGELSSDERRQVLRLEGVGAVGEQRVDAPLREAGEHAPRPARRRDHLALHQRERDGQRLPAVRLRERQALPTALGEQLPRLLEAGRRLDGGLVDPRAALAVAHRVERIEHLGAQLRRLVDHHVDRRAVAIGGGGECRVVLLDLKHLVEEEAHVADGRVVIAARDARGRARGRRQPHGHA